MREILFRAKRIDNGEWIEGYLFKQVGVKDQIYFAIEVIDNTVKSYKVDESTICQYIGLRDKNGNKIWENDIVEYQDCTDEKYVVAYESSKAMFEHQQYGCSIMNFDELSGMEVEVIGNIFDNAELLEG